MAISTITLASISGGLLHSNDDVDETSDSVDSGAGTLWAIEVDNTGNAAVTFVKLYNNGAPTVGTTAPDFIFAVPASVSRAIIFPQGFAYSTALSIAAVTAAGTAGTTGPTSLVTARVVYS